MRFDFSSIETVQAGWVETDPKKRGEFDPSIFDQLAEKPFLRRFRRGTENSGERYYYDPTGFYISVSTFTRKTAKVADTLGNIFDPLTVWKSELDKLDWRYTLGVSSNAVLKAASIYGTFFHKYISDYVKGNIAIYSATGEESLLWQKDLERDFLNAGYAQVDFNACKHWIFSDFENDMYAFLSWLDKHNVTVVATDTPVKSEKGRVAGVLDMVCWVDTTPENSGKKGRKLVVVDFKTSASDTVYEDHKRQVCVYEHLLKTANPNLPIDGAYLWKPRNRPSGKFSFVDCTDAYAVKLMDLDMQYCISLGIHKPEGVIVKYIGRERIETTYDEWLYEQFNIPNPKPLA